MRSIIVPIIFLILNIPFPPLPSQHHGMPALAPGQVSLLGSPISENVSAGFIPGRGRISRSTVAIRWVGEAANAGPVRTVHDLDGDGIPEVVYSTRTELIVLDGRSGSLKFRFLPGGWLWWLTHDDVIEDVAVVDLGGRREIVLTTAYCGMVHALSADGDVLWEISLVSPGNGPCTKENPGWRILVLSDVGDVDGDGVPELLINEVEEGVGILYCVDARGHLEWVLSPGVTGGFNLLSPVIADFDVDGEPEIVTKAYRYSEESYLYVLNGRGELEWSTRVNGGGMGIRIHDLDGDGIPEAIFGCGGSLCAAEYGRGITWSIGVVGNVTGAPAIADLDGDGEPELVLVTREAYLNIVHPFDGVEHVKLPSGLVTQPPVVADIDGDGSPEILCLLPVWDGGQVDGLLYVLNTSGSLEWSLDLHNPVGPQETPLVADVDGDGELEILVRVDGRLVALDSAEAHLEVVPRDGRLDISCSFGELLLGSPRVEIRVIGSDGIVATLKVRRASLEVDPGRYRVELLMEGRPIETVEVEVGGGIAEGSWLILISALVAAAVILILMALSRLGMLVGSAR